MFKRVKKITSSKSENSQAIFNILATTIVGGINFLTLPIFTNILGTEGFGEVSLYTTWVQIFTLFIGLQSSGTFASASVAFPENEQSSYQKSILLFSICCSGVFGVICILFLNRLSTLIALDKVIIIWMFIHSFGAYCISLFNNRFIFTKQAQRNFAISISVCLATTFLSLLLPPLQHSLYMSLHRSYLQTSVKSVRRRSLLSPDHGCLLPSED